MPGCFWIAVRPLAKSFSTADMRVGGWASVDDTIDLDGEVFHSRGVVDSLRYLVKAGHLNWDHNTDPDSLLGKITKAEVRRKGRKDGIYIEARLNPLVKKAVHAYRYMYGGGVLGFSVEGVTLRLSTGQQDGYPASHIEESFLAGVALTPNPKNVETAAYLLKSFPSLTIRKSLTAGSGTDSAAFTGGRALVSESLGGLPAADLVRLARHYHAVHGCGAPTEAALGAFTTTWALSPAQRAQLQQFLQRR